MQYSCLGVPSICSQCKAPRGHKLPCWQPCSCRGTFVGLSAQHSSDIPQIFLNLHLFPILGCLINKLHYLSSFQPWTYCILCPSHSNKFKISHVLSIINYWMYHQWHINDIDGKALHATLYQYPSYFAYNFGTFFIPTFNLPWGKETHHAQ